MTDEIYITCPECEYEETTGLVPTFKISAQMEVDITVTKCSECGYEREK